MTRKSEGLTREKILDSSIRLILHIKAPSLYQYLVMSAQRTSLAAPCRTELKKFADQNIAWLDRVLTRLEADRALPSGLGARGLAEVIFGAFEGFMMIALSEEDPQKGFRVRAEQLLRALCLDRQALGDSMRTPRPRGRPAAPPPGSPARRR